MAPPLANEVLAVARVGLVEVVRSWCNELDRCVDAIDRDRARETSSIVNPRRRMQERLLDAKW